MINRRRLNRITASSRKHRGDGPRVIYRYADGQFQKTDLEPLYADRANFVIICNYGDWSGFRTLADCLSQELKRREDGFYSIVERF